jgi:proline dehydrogenase
MISFENTEIAFGGKTNAALNRAYWLFKIIGNPLIVKVGKSVSNFALKAGLPISGLIKQTIFSQFCGGETISECQATITHLQKFNIGTILDYSVEGKASEDDLDTTVREIIDTILTASKNPAIYFAVFKLTGISKFNILEKANDPFLELSSSEQDEYNTVISRVDSICKVAYENNIPIFIDAEESWIQRTIDQITLQMMRKYNKEKAIIYNTLQSYRHDRIAYLKEMINLAREESIHYGIKLVRGAYLEKERDRAKLKNYPSPIQPDKTACDTDFDTALKLIIKNIDVLALCAGTHNEKSSLYLTELLRENNISPNDKRICFAQLLGMSDHITYNLSNAGYNVAKYVPYGPVREVMPYLLRRADENTSIAGQTSRELSLIVKEKKRRRKEQLK